MYHLPPSTIQEMEKASQIEIYVLAKGVDDSSSEKFLIPALDDAQLFEHIYPSSEGLIKNVEHLKLTYRDGSNVRKVLLLNLEYVTAIRYSPA